MVNGLYQCWRMMYITIYVVNLVSNCHWIEPLQQATDWSKQEIAIVSLMLPLVLYTTVQIVYYEPYLIRHYNEIMRGVDRINQNVENYHISIRS